MQIKLLFENNKFITIQLLNEPLINKWFNFFYHTEYYSRSYHCPPWPINQEMINWHWEEIKSVRDILLNLGYLFPFSLTENFNYQQSTLNDLHRFFTYNILWSHERHRLNPYDSSFSLPNNIDNNQWHELLNRINLSVHFLEKHIHSNLGKKEIYSLFGRKLRSFHAIPKERIWLDFESFDQRLNQNFLSFTTDIPVILDDSILGKSFLQSFATDDDPTCRDCTGRLGSHGGFYIDFNNDRKKLYISQPFQNWLKKFNLDTETVPYEFLIGYVSDMSDIPVNLFYSLNIVDIERFSS